MGDMLIMSGKERRRKVLLEGVKSGHLTLKEAAKRIKVSYRQSKRIWKRYQEEEDGGSDSSQPWSTLKPCISRGF